MRGTFLLLLLLLSRLQRAAVGPTTSYAHCRRPATVAACSRFRPTSRACWPASRSKVRAADTGSANSADGANSRCAAARADSARP